MKVGGARMLLAWIGKCGAVVIPANTLPRMWPTHPHLAFGLGLAIGTVAQHFIPPRGRFVQLCFLVALQAGMGVYPTPGDSNDSITPNGYYIDCDGCVGSATVDADGNAVVYDASGDISVLTDLNGDLLVSQSFLQQYNQAQQQAAAAQQAANECLAAMNAAAGQAPSPIPHKRSIIAGIITGVVTYFLPPQWGGGSVGSAVSGFLLGLGVSSTQNYAGGGLRGQAALMACYASQNPFMVPVGN